VVGDGVLLDFEDAAGVRQLLAESSRMRRRPKVREKVAAGAPAPEPEPAPAAAPAAPAGAAPQGFWARVDHMLEKAEARWGAVLPSWAFTRAMLYGLVLLVVAAFVVPGVVSMGLVIAGLLAILFGAVVFTDPMLASRWLPGRMTPMHVMVAGAVLVMLGVVVGLLG
jgi:hypothetical protein